MTTGVTCTEVASGWKSFVKVEYSWLKSTARMVAPTDELADEEMGVADDGEGAGDAAVEPRAGEPGDDPPPPRPREVRPSPMRPGAEDVRQHNLTHGPYQSWCEVCVAHWEAPQSKDGDVARSQMDFMFVGAEGTFVDQPRAKATVLIVICKDDAIRTAICSALSRSLEGYKPDVTKQRLCHRQALEDIKRSEHWNVRMERFRLSCVRIICRIA